MVPPRRALCVALRSLTQETYNVKTLKAGLLALCLSALSIPAFAQQMQWTDKGFVSVNGGVQAASHNLSATQRFPLFDEDVNATSNAKIKSSGLFDISAGYRVWHNVAASIGYTFASSTSDLHVDGSVPDPVFFDRPHPFNATLNGAKHRESVINLAAVYMMPITDKVDLGISLGPSIFVVKQDVAANLSGANQTPSLSRANKTTGGFNLGVDVTYLLGRRWGVGGLARYPWGRVKIGDDHLTVGGFQVGAGGRLRF
jgi:hypothetical protein